MKFFPSDPYARAALVEMLGEMCESEDQVRWLVKEVRTKYPEWPGVYELRRLFCARFRPQDGIVVADSSGGVEGTYTFTLGPSQAWPPESKQIGGPQLKALPAGHVASASKALDAGVTLLVDVNGLRRSDAFSAPATAEEIAAAPAWLRRLEGYEDSPTR